MTTIDSADILVKPKGSDSGLNGKRKVKMPTNDGGVPSRMQSSSTINDTPFTINVKWRIEFGNALQLISLYENTSGRPIKAFRVTWGVLDDFGEVAFKLKTEFTGSSTYLSGEDKTQGHVIEPGEKIYYSMSLFRRKLSISRYL